MKGLLILSIGLLLGGMYVQYRITGSLLGRVTTQEEFERGKNEGLSSCKETEVWADIDGYKCEEIESTRSDLLQPSGYWVGTTFSCWKLQTPIEEWCKINKCSK